MFRQHLDPVSGVTSRHSNPGGDRKVTRVQVEDVPHVHESIGGAIQADRITRYAAGHKRGAVRRKHSVISPNAVVRHPAAALIELPVRQRRAAGLE